MLLFNQHPQARHQIAAVLSLDWNVNGLVSAGYLVFYTTDATQNDRDWAVEGVMGEKLTTTIKKLTPETTYYFKVQARNSKGYGPMSPTVIFRTPKGQFQALSYSCQFALL